MIQLKFHDSKSNRTRTLLLDEKISSGNLVDLLASSFDEKSSIVGFRDDQGIIYPVSVVTSNPVLFGRKPLVLIKENEKSFDSTGLIDFEDSEASLYTDKNADAAFCLIDQDKDGYISKDDIEIFVNRFKNMYGDKLVIAQLMATIIFDECGLSDDESLTLSDFSAWYLSTSHASVRSVIKELVLSTESSPSLSRCKSQTCLEVSQPHKPDNISVEDAIKEIQSLLGLNQVSLKGIQNAFSIAYPADHDGDDDVNFPVTRENFHRRIRSLIDVTHGTNREDVNIDRDALFRVVDAFYNAFRDNGTEYATMTSILCGMIIFVGGNIRDNLFVLYSWFADLPEYSHEVTDGALRELCFHLAHVLFMLSSQMGKLTGMEWGHYAMDLYAKVLDNCHPSTPGVWVSHEFVAACLICLEIVFSLVDGNQAPGEIESQEKFFSPISKMDPSKKQSKSVELNEILSEYEGGTINILDAKRVLGLRIHSVSKINALIQEYIAQDYHLTLPSYQEMMKKMLGKHYLQLHPTDQCVADFLVNRLFSLFIDPDIKEDDTDMCDAFDLTIGLLVFSGGSPFEKATKIVELLELTEELNSDMDDSHFLVDANYLELCITPILKTIACLDPHLSDMSNIDDISMELSYFFALNTEALKDKKEVPVSFLILWIATIYKLFHDANGQILMRQAILDMDVDRMTGLQKMIDEIQVTFTKDVVDDNLIIDTESPSKSLTDRDCSRDEQAPVIVEEGEDGLILSIPSSTEESNMSLPSPVLSELQEAKSILGYQGFRADDIMESIAENSPQGQLTLANWLQVSHDLMSISNVAEGKREAGNQLAIKIFSQFVEENIEMLTADSQCSFFELAAGIVLFSDSPMEDKLLVSFTMVDTNRDSQITYDEFLLMVSSYIKIVCATSQLAAAKVSACGSSPDELAAAVTKECFGTLGLDENSLVTIEQVCEVANDCIVLAESVQV